jgi:Ser/Thr protein kinase RdoA (MazF antagonist)
VSAEVSTAREQVVGDLAAAWSIGPHTLHRLGASHNHAYRVEAAGETRYLLRMHVSHRTVSQIDAELTWIELLASEGEVVVPRPVRTRDGAWTSESMLESRLRRLSLLQWIDGTMLSALPPHADVTPFARSLAALHLRGEGADARDLAGRRRRYDGDYARARLAVIAANCPAEVERGTVRADLEHGLRALEAALAADDEPIMIHGDYHPGNLLLTGDRPAVIDFDRAGLGPAALDVASAILYLLPRQRVRFHAAYADAGGPARVAPETFGAFLFFAYLDNVAHLSKVASESAAMPGNIAQLAAFGRAL